MSRSRNMIGLLAFLLAWACVPADLARAQVIVLPGEPTPVEKTAATTLREELYRISGETLPVVSEADAPKGRKAPFRFYVGATRAASRAKGVSYGGDAGAWKEDEILIRSIRGGMVLTGHPTRGPLYAVNTLLEEGYGVRWWTSTEADYPSRPVLPVPEIDRSYAPPLRIREVSILDAYDADFRVRLRGNAVSRVRSAARPPEIIPAEKGGCHQLLFFEGRKSCFHSFFEILPPKRHFETHPEWYSLKEGRRVAKQLCLTNKDMEAAFIEETLRLLRAHPEVDFISISQNDQSNYLSGSCECEACQALEAATGGVPSGPLLWFVNRVAEALEKDFPQVTVETFAYQYTVQAPKNVKPRPNVAIRFCKSGVIPISLPVEISSYPNSEAFRKNLSDWTTLSPGQVFVWDYVAHFNNYLLPHPDLLTLGPNIRFFTQSGAFGVFEQGDTCSGAGELDPLRLWLIYHLLWNPSADDRALIEEFVRGYYGEAAVPGILRYISIVNETPAAGNIPVPLRHMDCSGWMTPATLVAAVRAMEDAADAAAAAGEPYASRVRRETLSTRNALLLHWNDCKAFCEQWKLPWTWGETRREAAERWISDCKAFGVPTVRETVAERAPALFDKYCENLLNTDESIPL